MALLSKTFLEDLAALNEVKLSTTTGGYIGTPLGDLIKAAMQNPPLDVWTGTADPTVSPGIPAARTGDLYLRDMPGPDGGELWVKVGDAPTAWGKAQTAGDNLGNHIATMNLNMNHFDVVNVHRFESDVTSGPTAIGTTLDTAVALVAAGAKLLSLKNFGTEKLAVDKDGNITLVGTSESAIARSPDTARLAPASDPVPVVRMSGCPLRPARSGRTPPAEPAAARREDTWRTFS